MTIQYNTASFALFLPKYNTNGFQLTLQHSSRPAMKRWAIYTAFPWSASWLPTLQSEWLLSTLSLVWLTAPKFSTFLLQISSKSLQTKWSAGPHQQTLILAWFFCTGYFVRCSDKIPEKDNFRKTGEAWFWLALWRYSLSQPRSWEMTANTQLSFSFLFSLGDPAHGMGLPQLKLSWNDLTNTP